MFNKVVLVEGEKIKPINNHNGYYITSNGRVYSEKYNRFMKPNTRKDGYVQVMIGKRKCEYIHRLVAHEFCIKHFSECEVNHIDGNKSNNCASNLEWVTSKENKEHAERIGLSNHNNKQRSAVSKASSRIMHGIGKMIKISIDEASEICEAYSTGIFSMNEIASSLKVHRSTIFLIIKGAR